MRAMTAYKFLSYRVIDNCHMINSSALFVSRVCGDEKYATRGQMSSVYSTYIITLPPSPRVCLFAKKKIITHSRFLNKIITFDKC